MRVTSKGQVTIPIAIRERMGIRAETEVEFDVVDGEIRLRVVSDERTAEDIVRGLIGRASTDLTTDEILELTRGESSD